MVVELCVLCLYVNLKLCVSFAELGLEDSPPLTHPSVSSWSSREKKLYAKCAKVEAQLKESREHGYYSSKRQLIICAAEILKWSVGLKGEERGHGMQFFRANLNKPVQVSI
jgi:hypothetical protein